MRLRTPAFLACLAVSGSASADIVALEAVRRWRFEPAKNQGTPVPVIFKLTVGFKP